MLTFKDFFNKVTGYYPFPYQEKLADSVTLPSMMRVPTGAGKTSAVVTAWAWRRFFHPDKMIRENTPRRLVYCLPMRSLVGQTLHTTVGIFRQAAELVTPVGNSRGGAARPVPGHGSRLGPVGQELKVGTYVVMGGDQDDRWMLNPEEDQVIVGTQDMLISRFLNRGYGMSRFKWPWAFGLLTNDCLWVFDEVQLMGNGLATSTQVAAFIKKMGSYRPNHFLWLSATLEEEWFNSVDFAGMDTRARQGWLMGLDREDKGHPSLCKRLGANKKLYQLNLRKGRGGAGYFSELAREVLNKHVPGCLTLVILNRVEWAQAAYGAIRDESKKRAVGDGGPGLLLIHSRFRPREGAAIQEKMLEAPGKAGKIVVATQAVEAGIDISSALLITDLCPWASLVQRLGRLNRSGEYESAQAYWLDIIEKDCPPYGTGELELARKIMREMEGKLAAPGDLPKVAMPYNPSHVMRRKDVLELFDTTPDLSGNDLDISRYVRDGVDTDLQFYWATWEGDNKGVSPPQASGRPRREELCPVSLESARGFIKGRVAWHWDYLDGRWRRVSAGSIYPGMVLLVPALGGGYSEELGYTGGDTGKVKPVAKDNNNYLREDSTADDQEAFAVSKWQTIEGHTDEVVAELQALLKSLGRGLPRQVLEMAARWHDAGKAHQVFQETVSHSPLKPPRQGEVWAKCPGRHLRHRQPHFRHELASALVFLKETNAGHGLSQGDKDLVAYLVAAHHGKVRLSLRSLPGEKLPRGIRDRHARVVRGVWDGSVVSAACLGGNIRISKMAVDLTPAEMGLKEDGSISWLQQTLSLLDKYGPFRLAYLEALIRAADARASTN